MTARKQSLQIKARETRGCVGQARSATTFGGGRGGHGAWVDARDKRALVLKDSAQ